MRGLLPLGLLGLLACDTAASPVNLTASASLAELQPAVFRVQWKGAGEGASVVAEWGYDEDYGQRVALGEGDEGEGIVLGAHPSATVHWRVVTGEGAATDDQTIETGELPVTIRSFEVTESGDALSGLVLTSTLDNQRADAVMVDLTGTPVWWLASDGPKQGFSDVRAAADGKGVIYQVTDPKLETDIGTIIERDWAGEVRAETPTPGGHHAFVELPDDHYGYCMIDVRETTVDGELRMVVGDAIAEIPVGGDPATDLHVIWDSWDALPMRAAVAGDSGFYSFGLDWIHCNGLSYDADTGKYLMSSYSLGSVFQVDRATGATDWVLGGEDATLTLPEGLRVGTIHSPERTADGVRVFNNRNVDSPHSRVVTWKVDEAASTAAEGEAIDLDGEYFSQILGDATDLPDDHLLISWGSSGLLTEVDAERNVVWEASLPLGVIVGFSGVLPSIPGAVE